MPTVEGRGIAAGVTVEWGAVTDVGRVRAVNEDAVLAEPPVFVVADGMGGHRAGDVASRLVVDRFAELIGSEARTMDEVAAVIGGVNRAILEQGRSSAERSGMGTTAVGLLLVENGDAPSFLLFNIGDSRAYCFSEGRLEQLSVDHSYVQELVDAGELSIGAARHHPQRNVVTRALGVEESVSADYWLRSPEAGERYLLCSDGLSSEVDDGEIHVALASPVAAEEAARGLLQLALDAGGRDNISVLVLDVVEVERGGVHDTAPKGIIAAALDPPEPSAAGAHPRGELLDSDAVPSSPVVADRVDGVDADPLIDSVPRDPSPAAAGAEESRLEEDRSA